MKFRIMDLLWLMFAAAIVAGLWARQHRAPVKLAGNQFQVMEVKVHVDDLKPEPVKHAIPITWDDLHLGMEPDQVFDPQRLTERVRSLEGQGVQIAGPMHGAGFHTTEIVRFILTRNVPNRSGLGRPADELLTVLMREGKTASYTHAPVRVTGLLRIAPETGDDGNTLVIFRLDDATIEKVR